MNAHMKNLNEKTNELMPEVHLQFIDNLRLGENCIESSPEY